MAAKQKRRFWRVCRVYFRHFRISVWLLVLALLGAVIYVNQVGLPEFAKRPLLRKLRARGVDLQFSRLRVSWYQGIVAENVHFGPAGQAVSPHLTVGEVQVHLNWTAAAHLQLQIDSLMLRQGRVSWPFTGPNQTREELAVGNIQTDLRFLPGDQWSLDHFKAQFAGADIQLSGVVTNASAIRDWKIFQGEQPVSRSALLWQDRLRNLSDTLGHIHFTAPPELRLNIRGDALNLQTFNVLLSLSAPGAETPWGTISDGRFAVHLFSVDSNGVSRAEADLHAADAQTPWAAITNFALNIKLTSADLQTNLVNGELKLSSAQVNTPWAQGSNALFTATWSHSITNPIPVIGRGNVHCEFAQSPWGSARDILLRADLLSAPVSELRPDTSSWSWWTNLQPYQLSWDCRLLDLKSPKLVAEAISCAGDWTPPLLSITNLDATLFDGHLAAQLDVDVATRRAHAKVESDLDPHRFASYFSDEARNWLERFNWGAPPQISGELTVTVPPWTNAQPDWREIRPSLELRSEVTLPQGASYGALQISSARSGIFYSNLTWNLPDLEITRPEGRLTGEVRFDESTKDLRARVRSNLDPTIVRSLLDADAGRVFDLIQLSQPPNIEAEIINRGPDLSTARVRGQLLLSNLTFRGESLSRVETSFQCSGNHLLFIQPRVDTGARYVKADSLEVDLAAQLIYLTNGYSIVDPMLVARAIGPHIVRVIEKYQFGTPPTARVYGIIPLHGEEDADLHFELTGGPFHWWKLNVPHITGQVHWSGLHLSVTNVQADFYHGLAFGSATFDFPPTPGTDFQFVLSVTNILLQSLMADLSPSTNNPEGRVYGDLAITKANSEDWQSVFGYGEAHLRDGLLWNIPLFGIFTPILNGIAPGLGNSRANAAVGSFIITNGVIRTSDLDIRSTGMRLEYRGTVNLESQLNARVDAELLRDMWLVGPLVSTVFWPVSKLFEYRVSGTLATPTTEPVFIIPKIMLMPFHPFKTLKGLRQEDPNSNPNFSPLPP
jgi:hypothetical protein